MDTYYVVNENILTQVVNFDEKTTFPVIADPSAWKIAKLVVLAYAAGDAKKYARHIGGSFKNLCEIILGIDTIKSQCKF